MSTKIKKTLATTAIVLLFASAYVLYIYYKAGKDEVVPTFSSILFAVIPAIILNTIWNGIPVKKKK